MSMTAATVSLLRTARIAQTYPLSHAHTHKHLLARAYKGAHHTSTGLNLTVTVGSLPHENELIGSDLRTAQASERVKITTAKTFCVREEKTFSVSMCVPINIPQIDGGARGGKRAAAALAADVAERVFAQERGRRLCVVAFHTARTVFMSKCTRIHARTYANILKSTHSLR